MRPLAKTRSSDPAKGGPSAASQLGTMPRSARKHFVKAGRAPLVEINVAQSERIADHRDGGEAHGRGSDDRREQDAEDGIKDARGDGHAERVIDEGEE